MAKIRKCRLAWEASASEDVVGYKLYWSKGSEVDYESRCIKIGNVTEISLPDDVTLSDGPVMFGVTAVDRDGNESDMVTLGEPYRMQVPEAPMRLSLQPSDDFRMVDTDQLKSENLQLVDSVGQEPDDEDILAQAIEDEGRVEVAQIKDYDSIGHSKKT